MTPDQFRAFMLKHKMNGTQMAEALGISKPSVSQYASGGLMPPYSIQLAMSAIADGLKPWTISLSEAKALIASMPPTNAREAIIEAIKSGCETRRAVSEKIGVNYDKVSQTVSRLKAEGLIEYGDNGELRWVS